MELVNEIDDAIDGIDEIVIKLEIFNIIEIRKDIYEFVEPSGEDIEITKKTEKKIKKQGKFPALNYFLISFSDLPQLGHLIVS